MADDVFAASIFIEAPPEEVFKYFTADNCIITFAISYQLLSADLLKLYIRERGK